MDRLSGDHNILWVCGMGILRIDLIGGEPGVLDLARLEEAVLSLPDRAPVTFLIHGYRYEPGHHFHDPHRHIFSADPGGSGRSLSWVRHLGFRGPDAPPGLAVALGWNGRGTLWSAHRRSDMAARALAHLVARVVAVSPGRPVNVIAHSLGARVVLSALPHLGTDTLSRVVLMSAAAFRDETIAALDTPAGRTCEFVNVTSRENDLFDLCMEIVIAAGLRASIGLGIGRSVPNWVDVQLDDTRVLKALDSLGFAVDAGARRVCHWSTFRRPGIFALYRALLCDPDPLPLRVLKAALPDTQSARWSRLLALPEPEPLLSLGRDAPS